MPPGLMQPIHAATGKTEGDAVNGRIRGPGTTGSRRHFIAKEIYFAMCKIPGFAANKASRRSAKQMPATRVVLGTNRPMARNISNTPVIAA